MKNLRPFQIGVIAVFVVAALVGLYVFTTFKGFGTGAVQVGAVSIWGTLPQDAMVANLQNLASTNSKYAKVTYTEHSAATFDSDLANAIASGQGPDLVIITQEQLLTEEPKLSPIPFTTIPQRTYLDSYLPIFELYLTDTGSYGIPYVVDPLVLYYNRSTLSSASVPTPPASWEAVAGLAMKLSARTPTGVITKSAISLGDYANITNARAILSLLLLQAGTAITTTNADAGTRSALVAGADTTFGATPAQAAVSFYTQFADPAKSLYSWNRSLPASRQAFIGGTLALYPGFASEVKALKAANPNLDFDMAAIPQPSTAPASIDYGLGYAFAIPKASSNPAGALATALTLSESGQLQAGARSLSMAPAQRSLLSPASDDLYAPVFYPQALIAKGWLSPAPYATDGIFSAMISDIATGRDGVPEAIVKADQSLNAALR